MFERFTEKAVKVVMLAQEETRRLGHKEVGTAELLLGLILEETGLASRVLRTVGVNLENARLEVEKIRGRGSDIRFNEHDFSDCFRRVVYELSIEEANQLKHREIAPEHLLLGLLREEEGTAIKVLQNLGAEVTQVRTQVFSMLVAQGDKNAAQFLPNTTTDSSETNRIKDYLAFIQKLLSYPDSSEVEFLKNYPNLFNSGLMIALEGVASILAQQGDHKGARYLQDIAVQLTKKEDEKSSTESINQLVAVPDSPPATELAKVNNITNIQEQFEQIANVQYPTPEATQNFLFQLLRVIFESKADSQVVYPFLEENLDKLNESFPEVLRDWATAQLSRVGEEQKPKLAKRITALSTLIRKFELGDPATNLEIALTGYEIVDNILTKAEDSVNWAANQYCLGLTYLERSKRSKGSQEENLKQAINCFTEALKVYDKDNFPKQRKLILNNLKNATREMRNIEELDENNSSNDIIENIGSEEPISDESSEHTDNLSSDSSSDLPPIPDSQLEFLLQVLQITETSSGNPQLLYPLLQKNLDKLDANLAGVLRNWATATLTAVEPEQAQNIAAVIGGFSELIQQFPLGNPATQLKIAITGFEVSATVFTSETFPEQATQIQNNIRQTVLLQIFLEIEASQGNLQLVYPLLEANIDKLDENFAQFLRSWGTAAVSGQQNLVFTSQLVLAQGIAAATFAFSTLIKDFSQGDKESNLEIAIAGYEVAAIVFNRDQFSPVWAEIQNKLGEVYLERRRGERPLNLQQAIKFFLAALKVYTPEQFPEQREIVEQNLNKASLEARQLGKESNQKFNHEELEAIYENFIESLIEGSDNGESISFLMANSGRIDFESSLALFEQTLKRKLEDKIAELPQEDREEAALQMQRLSQAWSQELVTTFHYSQFFEEVKEAMIDGNNDPSLLFPILENNLDKLNEQFSLFLRGLALKSWLPIETYIAENEAKAISNLSAVILGFPKGDHALNVEIAIAGFQKVLEVFTRNSFPILWAKEQRNLAEAYIFRVRGDKADNLERAIRHCENALEIIKSNTFPEEWAMIQDTIGSAYINFAGIRGDKSEYIELAINHYKKAEQAFPPEAKRESVVIHLNYLGNAYLERIKERREDNIEIALSYFNKGIELITPETYQGYWIMLQGSLANVYRDRIKGKQSENFKEAISRYESVLQLQAEKTFEWASTQLNLGLTYWKLDKNNAESQEAAITCYEKALTVYTQTDYPEEWAKIKNNLGVVYRHRLSGNPDENIRQAFFHFQNALQVYTRENFALYRAETLFSIAWAYQATKQFINAYNSCKEGIEIIESLRGQIVSGDEIKQKFAEDWNQIYRVMVEVCLELAVNDSQYYLEAIEYVERSKARNLLELLATRDVESKEISERIGLMPVKEILELLDENTAIVEWYLTDNCFYTFIITSKKPTITVWKSSQKEYLELYTWGNFYFQFYRQDNKNWQKELPSLLREIARILNFNHLINIIPANCDKLILIPHRLLHLLPLHALPLHNGDCLLDCLLEYSHKEKHFTRGIHYAPSCQIWQQIQSRQRPNFDRIFGVQNPTLDLNYTDIEVQVIKQMFNSNDILVKQDAKKEEINNSRLRIANCAHFSCHGYFNFEDSLRSALILADAQASNPQQLTEATRYISLREGNNFDLEKCLTLGEIFSLDLNQCRLVTLSACETGLTDPKSISDEYVSLPSGFLYAGSPSVVASQWTVNDLSTTFLMIKFYENLQEQQKQQGQLNVAIALNQAQLWLRDATKEQLEEWTNKLPLSPTQEEAVYDCCSQMDSGSKPFHSPYYWAAFCSIGQ